MNMTLGSLEVRDAVSGGPDKAKAGGVWGHQSLILEFKVVSAFLLLDPLLSTPFPKAMNSLIFKATQDVLL